MTEYDVLLEKFKKTREQIKGLIDKYPSTKREQTLFDKWTLKDVLAHLNHWMTHDIDCLEHVLKNKEPFWEPDVEEFNRKGVEARKNKSWDELYLEFNKLSEQLISLYQDLPVELRNRKIWNSKNETPTRFLEEDIEHWESEHIPSLESNLI